MATTTNKTNYVGTLNTLGGQLYDTSNGGAYIAPFNVNWGQWIPTPAVTYTSTTTTVAPSPLQSPSNAPIPNKKPKLSLGEWLGRLRVLSNIIKTQRNA